MQDLKQLVASHNVARGSLAGRTEAQSSEAEARSQPAPRHNRPPEESTQSEQVPHPSCAYGSWLIVFCWDPLCIMSAAIAVGSLYQPCSASGSENHPTTMLPPNLPCAGSAAAGWPGAANGGLPNWQCTRDPPSAARGLCLPCALGPTRPVGQLSECHFSVLQ